MMLRKILVRPLRFSSEGDPDGRQGRVDVGWHWGSHVWREHGRGHLATSLGVSDFGVDWFRDVFLCGNWGPTCHWIRK